jgi:hypothetical protein
MAVPLSANAEARYVQMLAAGNDTTCRREVLVTKFSSELSPLNSGPDRKEKHQIKPIQSSTDTGHKRHCFR